MNDTEDFKGELQNKQESRQSLIHFLNLRHFYSTCLYLCRRVSRVCNSMHAEWRAEGKLCKLFSSFYHVF